MKKREENLERKGFSTEEKVLINEPIARLESEVTKRKKYEVLKIIDILFFPYFCLANESNIQ